MSTILKHIPIACVALLLLSGCNKVEPDNKVHYGYLRNCIWIPADHSDDFSSFPGLSISSSEPVQFTSDGKVLPLKEESGGYVYTGQQYRYKINEESDDMTLIIDGKDYLYTFHLISQTHMTLFYKDNDRQYISFVRGELP